MKQPNMNQLMKQAQKMQAEMEKAQAALADERVEASVGGGMVKVAMKGDMTVESVVIDPDAIDPEDADMLQDMVTAAVNEAVRMVQELQDQRMSYVTGGMGCLPGLM
jgi:DNA-binding YbaB/EbfC family protein